jgi:hypothetical protein
MDIAATEALRAMETGEAADARRAVEALRPLGPPTPGLARALWTSFLALLGRRGYFARSPGEIEASLREIGEVGEGFDLYDLARSLCRYDSAFHTNGDRVFPVLARFALPHRKDRRGTKGASP